MNGTGERDWYKDAIIYELRVRSFYDSDADGVGDLRGATEKLDYISDLGVTAVWLLPFYPSPGRDDGYDISNYTDVQPEIGTLKDFERFLREAHRRKIRVITELVLNHTSDQHPWFRAARSAPPGSPERDFYVWSDDPDRYREARVIFQDFEPSNWTWDPVAKAYYWHRFYAHQPDLNFENPAVEAALLEVVDFWFRLGVDGVRLDAVPYLFEREGTSCENLPETHGFLKKLRRHIDERFEDRMILAEANQWPEDAAAYFGRGDECHMNFHFPLMPRMFMALHMEDRLPLVDIFAQTPALPPCCQWALFLRNHDELTLEMVTDEERDYMVRAYAHETAMRVNLGIRRRLAPLVGSDRRRMELLNGLLFSLPGTPVVYYGDEIGMGDNVYLGDRDGVRTPMQWSGDRNAGFSRANPQRLVLPIVIDPDYHYESLNVEAQQNNPSSLLWWMKRLLSLRKRWKAFGRGEIEFLQPDNHKVLPFLRTCDDQVVLVVANLSRNAQFVELDLSPFRGTVPVELFGNTEFPVVADRPYVLTLAGHSFLWFSLLRPSAAELERIEHRPSVIDVEGDWTSMFDADSGARLEALLPSYLESRAWFEGSHVASVTLEERYPIPEADVVLAILAVRRVDGETERHMLALSFAEGERAAELRSRPNAPVVALVRTRDPGGGVLFDALADTSSAAALLKTVLRGDRIAGKTRDLVSTKTEALETFSVAEREPRVAHPATEARLIGNEAVAIREALFFKPYRRLDAGMSLRYEVGRHLTRVGGTASVPRVGGAIELHTPGKEPVTLAIVEELVPNEGTALTHARAEIARLSERVLTERRGEKAPLLPDATAARLALSELPDFVPELLGSFQASATLLGQRVAEVHLALASDKTDPSFAPEPFSVFDQRSVYQSIRNLVRRVIRLLRATTPQLSGAIRAQAEALLAIESTVLARLEPVLGARITTTRSRVHGQLGLDRILFTGKDFVITDFDGDRRKALSERRRKRLPLADVARVVCSLHDVATLGLLDDAIVRDEDRARLAPWIQHWFLWSSATFVRAYLDTAGNRPIVPTLPEHAALLIESFELACFFEDLGAALETKRLPLSIPLSGLSRLLNLVEHAA